MKNTYSHQLRVDLRKVTKQLEAMEREIENPKRVDDAFLQKYQEVNELRIKKRTLESRIKNYGKNDCVLPQWIPQISNQ